MDICPSGHLAIHMSIWSSIHPSGHPAVCQLSISLIVRPSMGNSGPATNNDSCLVLIKLKGTGSHGVRGRRGHILPPLHVATHGGQGVPDTNQKPRLNKNPKTKHYEQAGGIVFFIDITPGGELAQRLQKVENKFCKTHNVPRLRFVEKCGDKLENLLCKADPWSGTDCGRDDCYPCKMAEDGDGLGQCVEREVKGM